MNYFEPFNWEKFLSLYPERQYSINEYHKILSPDYPQFIDKYLELPLLKRLAGIGLLCGTDWTTLYKNRIYYSRLDHSIGVALIIWNFTRNKAQTIAGLLHDVSTPVFSHVSDFRKGDALTQTATEKENLSIIRRDRPLLKLLEQDNLTVEEVEDYHKYPIADNEIPQLSADRLEYMFPSGMALEGSWTMEKVREIYNDICILKNEDGQDELGFKTLEHAEEYCRLFCMTSHILQLNENKLTLHLLGQIMNKSVELKILEESDFMKLSEKDLLTKLELGLEKATKGTDPSQGGNGFTGTDPSKKDKLYLHRLYQTFRTMTKIEHTEKPMPEDEYFSVSIKVKQRYINPLVCTKGTDPSKNTALRLSETSTFASMLIKDFLEYKDTTYGCVKLI